jgi:hypothetical protein
MTMNGRLERPTMAALLSLLVFVAIPYAVLTVAAPGARGVHLFLAFPLWTIGLWPADRALRRLAAAPPRGKPSKATPGLDDLA